MISGQAFRSFMKELTVKTEGMNAAAAVRAIVETAEAARERVLTGTPRPSGYETIVDGVRSAPLTSVRPDGMIVFRWHYLGEIAREVRNMMLDAAPWRTGRYTEGFMSLVDGDPSDLRTVPETVREITLVFSADYARRLEVGLRADRVTPFAVQVPRHNIEQVAIAARRLYGDVAIIEFRFVSLVNAYRHGDVPRHWNFRRRRAKETHVTYPAIVLSARHS